MFVRVFGFYCGRVSRILIICLPAPRKYCPWIFFVKLHFPIQIQLLREDPLLLEECSLLLKTAYAAADELLVKEGVHVYL